MRLLSACKLALRRTLARLGLTGPLLRRLTREVRSEGDPQAAYSLLVLKPERFRGDLPILSGEFGFRLVTLEKGWHQRLLEVGWGPDFNPENDYYNPPEGSPAWRRQRAARAVLRRVLPDLLRRLGADGVLASSTYYLDNWDYAAVAGELGIPYLVIYRECFQASQKDIDLQIRLGRMLGHFDGSHVFVHNETTRKALLDSGMVDPARISAPGCMRMDPFLRRLAEPRPRRERPLVTLFSFVPCAVLPHLCTSFTPGRDVGFVELFDQVHQRFGALAAAHPEVDFLIKPKWGGDWLEEIDYTLEQVGLKAADIPNLRIDPTLDAQDVILESSVVLGWGSTALCEAAVAGVPVIIPHFAEAVSEAYREYVLLTDYFDAFDIARSPEELERLVLERLADPTVPEAVMARRREAFERYVSPVAGGASAQYAATIRSIIDQARGRAPKGDKA